MSSYLELVSQVLNFEFTLKCVFNRQNCCTNEGSLLISQLSFLEDVDKLADSTLNKLACVYLNVPVDLLE